MKGRRTKVTTLREKVEQRLSDMHEELANDKRIWMMLSAEEQKQHRGEYRDYQSRLIGQIDALKWMLEEITERGEE